MSAAASGVAASGSTSSSSSASTTRNSFLGGNSVMSRSLRTPRRRTLWVPCFVRWWVAMRHRQAVDRSGGRPS
jgi:hypothetical protein